MHIYIYIYRPGRRGSLAFRGGPLRGGVSGDARQVDLGAAQVEAAVGYLTSYWRSGCAGALTQPRLGFCIICAMNPTARFLGRLTGKNQDYRFWLQRPRLKRA